MFKKNREYRNGLGTFELRAAADNAPVESDDKSMVVKGVPVVFNQATPMCEFDGVTYYEIIDPHAFDNCDMSDVIMNYNHSGKVVARLRNKTLKLNIDSNGMNIEAFLGGTEEGRDLYEEIKGGYIDKMSFTFLVDVNGDEYDELTHTRTIKHFKKLYDVAAVDIPAYEQTSLEARKFFEVEHSKELKALEQADLLKRCMAKAKI